MTIGLAGLALGNESLLATNSSPEALNQPARTDEEWFMQRAIALRQMALESGDQPYGALVVLNGRIVGESPSRVVLDQDPTAHAEMAAIRDAARRLQRSGLQGCILYSSSAACPMCEAAAYWAGIEKMVSGNPPRDRGEPRLC